MFRGRNTAGIEADARVAGIIGADDEIVVVARQGDALAQPGDVTQLDDLVGQADLVVVICNGGTSAQLVPIIMALVQTAEWEGYDHALKWYWAAYDVQMDGVTLLGGNEPSS